MANIESSLVGDNPGRPIDYYNLKLEKSVSDHDIPCMFKGFADYALPIGRGKAIWGRAGKLANAMAGGWSISGIVNYSAGPPLGFAGSAPLAGGWNGAVNRANVAPGPLRAAGYDKANFDLANTRLPSNTYLDRSKFSDPAPLTLGTGAFRYAQARGPGMLNEDLGIRKSHRINERYRLQLRADFFNVLNRHQVGGVNTNVNNALFGQMTTASGNRVGQVGVRLDF
jgi:hypothetical protein